MPHATLTLERLEARRLFAYDLQFGEAVVGALPRKAGDSVTITLPVRNFGDRTLTQPFDVEYKLVRNPYLAAGQLPDFFSAGAVPLRTVTVNDDIFAGSSGQDVTTTLTLPAGVAPGRYSIMARVDGAGAIAETNESNNYFASAGLNVLSAGGRLLVETGGGNDFVQLQQFATTGTGQPFYRVIVNGQQQDTFGAGEFTGADVRTGGGNDVITFFGVVPGAAADAGDGNDKIVGGSAPETLTGGAGKDTLFGGLGNDRLNGNGGNDRLYGELGADRLYGYAGNDIVDGGASADRLDGGLGADALLGQSGNDKFFARDGALDTLYGASGTDRADADEADTRLSIERSLDG
ncbi:MAG TPA: calcium-binding protein [Tepidisphaeraceae bacterium]|nr:calcium-binding protein [Tepidisphaeraceae bacterium]